MFCVNESDICDMRNAISPICSECGMPLEKEEEYERGICIVCWTYVTGGK
jgi:hypothetical protein